MISFDITSLFTNVPLTRTIQIILERLYGPEYICTYSDKRREEWCNKCKNRFEMKYLLETCTSDTNFNCNNKIYSQINAVAMGSSVGPLFADIYVNYLESKLMSRLKRNGILFWKRFVDDNFVIIKQVLKTSDLNPSAMCTSKSEKGYSLCYLFAQKQSQSHSQALKLVVVRSCFLL